MLAGFIFLGLKSSKQPIEPQTGAVDVSTLEWPSEQVKKETISESGKGYEISANYPITKGESISGIFHEFVLSAIDTFKTDTAVSEGVELPEGLTMTLDISYKEEKHATVDTYLFLVYSDTGGAHGLQATKTFFFRQYR